MAQPALKRIPDVLVGDAAEAHHFPQLFELSPLAYGAASVYTHSDTAGLCDAPSYLQPCKSVCQLHDLGLFLAKPQADFFTFLPDFVTAYFQALLVTGNNVKIVHVPSIQLLAQGIFHIAVNPSGNNGSKHLADLTAKAKSFPELRRLFRVELPDQFLRKTKNTAIRDLLGQCFHSLAMRNAVKERGKITDQNVSIRTVLADMPLQMAVHTPDRKIISFAGEAGAVVMNKSPLKQGEKRVFTKAALNNALSDSGTLDMPSLSSLKNSEFMKCRAFVSAVLKLFPCGIDIQRSICNVPLNACFPTDISPTFQISSIKISVAEYSLKVICCRCA